MGFFPGVEGAVEGGPSSHPSPLSSQDLPLSGYRAYGRFYERYWSRLFGVTVADLEELVAFIRREGEAQSLTRLARAVITSRLDRGPEIRSAPAPVGSEGEGNGGELPVVRMWDPAAAWRVGDHAIVPAPAAAGQTRPCVGEAVQVGDDHVLLRVDGHSAPQVYALTSPAGGEPVGALPSTVDTLSQAGGSLPLGKSPNDVLALVDEVLWHYGDGVVGKLLTALCADRRFVVVEGLWFLRDLAKAPREVDVVLLAREMFAGDAESWTLEELMALAAQRTDDSGQTGPESRVEFRTEDRYGWAVALEARPDLFERVATGSRSRWQLAGPPPMRYVSRHAVYDPESYSVLCVPGDTLPRSTVQRLWEAGLLHAALGRSDEVDTPVADRDAGGALPGNGQAKDSRSLWPRWLRFGRP